MFDYNSMIKRVAEFFPTWSDIRKRHNKSNGGQLLHSIVEESMDIEQALQKYKDFYFLDKYEGHENEVVAFAFIANIGKIDNLGLLDVYYNDELISLTDEIDEFMNSTSNAYYEDGNIYLRIEFVTDNKTIKIEYDDFSSEYELNKTHIWNIFDEFACFVGLTRQQNETNKELVDRILYLTKNLPNATEEGLKHSIISELMTIAPEITMDDIIIERATPENLLKPYESFNTLLDMMAEINRDVFKNKRWDLDEWTYDFKSIEYMDHKWDESLAYFQNGIGHDNDLEVIMSSAATETDANITLYDKSEERLLAYVHNKNINKNINFKLRRYNNIMNSINAKYKIKASKAIDITNEDIQMSIYEDDNKHEKRYVQDLFKFGSGIVAVDKSKLTDSKRYRLEFVPGKEITNMEISKCKVVYKHKYTKEIVEVNNLLKQAPGFILNAEGALVNTSIKRAIKSVNNMNSIEGLADSENGISLAPNRNIGTGSVSVSGLGMNFLRIDKGFNLCPLPKDQIRLNAYAFWKDDTITFRHDVNEERTVELTVDANALSFDVLDECSLDLFVNIDGISKYEKLIGPMTYSIPESDKPRNVKIKIISTENKAARIGNFAYSSHEIDYKLQYGDLLTTSDGQMMLPNFAQNSLIVTLKANSGSEPFIKGIYVGGDINKSIYRTEIIPHITDCDRIFEVTSNCQVNLLEVDAYGTVHNTIENYEPVTSYRATENNAWIRLSLDDYSQILNLKPNIGATDIISESGKQYYNIKLNNGDTVTSVTITGVKSTSAREISLTEMVKTYIPTYDISRDKMYCSKISNGLIISHNDPENQYVAILKIKNNIFEGINASKYKFTKLPTWLGVIFGSSNTQVQSYESTQPFEYISFYPAEATIHQAINEYDMFVSEMRGIKVVNNFAPSISMSDMMFYIVEPFENEEGNLDVRFSTKYDTNKNFSVLNNWCLGLQDIAIKTTANLSNVENYDVSEFDINEEVLLSKYVDIKPSYTLSNNSIVYSDKCMIIPPEGVTVEYRKYDGSNELSGLIKTEEIIIEEDGFNKLEYSNIDEILYLGTEPYSGTNTEIFTNYTLLKDEGIIVWTDNELIKSGQKIFLRYVIKKPIALVFSTDALYKEIGYMVDAYKEVNRIVLNNMQAGQRYDLRNIENFADVDLVHVLCTEPSFEAELTDTMVKFRKVAEQDSLMVKTGYYYINGKEYYLFSNKDFLGLDKPNFIETKNVEISGGEITLVKETNNFVRNSEMILKGMNELYNFNAKEELTYGISKLNSLTACDTFNGWYTFGTKMYLKDGLNGLALSFAPYIDNGYAYVDITEYITNNCIISFWADETLSVYIGKETKYMGLDFPRAVNIKIDSEIKAQNDNIRSARIQKEDDVKYYLIVKEHGAIDDIVITGDEYDVYTLHTKNIDKLGFNIKENKVEGSKIRLSIPNNKHAVSNGASLASDGAITMTSNIDWGLTTLKAYETRADFMTCAITNVAVDNEYLYTTNKEGSIETDPIFLNNPLAIKRLFFKINNINFENMKDIKVTIFVSNTRNGVYTPCTFFNNNYGFVYGDYLAKYIKIRLDIPKNKVVDNYVLFAEYKSDGTNYPKALTPSSGELLSKVFDTQETANYRTKSIKIDKVSNINDVEISIRAARDEYSADVWLPWKTVELDNNLKIKTPAILESARFFQIRVKLKTKDAYIKFKYLDIEVM